MPVEVADRLFEELNAEAERVADDVDRFFTQSLQSEADGRARLYDAMRQIGRASCREIV